MLSAVCFCKINYKNVSFYKKLDFVFGGCIIKVKERLDCSSRLFYDTEELKMGVFDRLKKSSEDRAFVVWHKKLDVPVFDNNRQLRIYSNTKLFESDYKRERNIFWGIPRDIIELKKIDDIPLFYNTMWIHYGCKNIVIDHNAPESLKI